MKLEEPQSEKCIQEKFDFIINASGSQNLQHLNARLSRTPTCIIESTRIRVTAVETLFSIKILNSFLKKRELIRKKKKKRIKHAI